MAPRIPTILLAALSLAFGAGCGDGFFNISGGDDSAAQELKPEWAGCGKSNYDQGLCGTTEPAPTPEPDAGTTEPEPTPEPDAGTTEPEPKPDAGTTEPEPTPEPDAGTTEPPPEPAPIYAPLAPEPATYGGPLVITSGGVYSGAWRSDDPNVPAVLVATDEPVIIEDCFVRTAGWGFREGAPGIDVTIRDCQIRPTAAGVGHAHAVGFASASNVALENNYLEDIDGFEIYQWWVQSTPSQTLRIVRNRAKNIRTHMGNFTILNTVGGLDGAEIAWNEVINEPGQSSVEDNINIYNSSGLPGSPLAIHDNFVWGAYPYPDPTVGGFTGTGMTTDGHTSEAAKVTAHIHAYDNQFVGTCNAAMNIAAGHDVLYEGNRMITSGTLADGRILDGTHAAWAIFDFYGAGGSFFYGNEVSDNVVGFVSFGYNNPYPDRHDGYGADCSVCTNNVSLPDPITYGSEQGEYTRWQQKVAAAGIQIGPR